LCVLKTVVAKRHFPDACGETLKRFLAKLVYLIAIAVGVLKGGRSRLLEKECDHFWKECNQDREESAIAVEMERIEHWTL